MDMQLYNDTDKNDDLFEIMKTQMSTEQERIL